VPPATIRIEGTGEEHGRFSEYTDYMFVMYLYTSFSILLITLTMKKKIRSQRAAQITTVHYVSSLRAMHIHKLTGH
jgi:hypothetical protein